MKNQTFKNILLCFCLLCYLFVCSTVIFYLLYIEKLNLGYGPPVQQQKQILSKPDKSPIDNELPKYHIEVWGKASISLYLWKHIMKASVLEINDGMMQVGNITIDNLVFNFKYGPAFIQTTVPSSVKYLILVLNGRTEEKVKTATQWLDYLPKFTQLSKVAVVLLGNEKCDNDWILPYMESYGGVVNVAFLVYDSPLVDNKQFYQWPLGVAEYRGFPNVAEASLNCFTKRHHKYNFIGTVYPNSSRATLVDEIKLKHFAQDILLRPRYEWLPKESEDSLRTYLDALNSSDLTLSPVGINSECYRIYEAMSFGSVAIIEDVVTSGKCDSDPPAPLRLLKLYKAPVIWIKDWKQLGPVFKREQKLTHPQIIKRRVKILKWYSNFKNLMRKLFVKVVKQKFSTSSINN